MLSKQNHMQLLAELSGLGLHLRKTRVALAAEKLSRGMSLLAATLMKDNTVAALVHAEENYAQKNAGAVTAATLKAK